MSVSFVSPLFWQIRFLVRNSLSSKKTYKAGVSELKKLVELYGLDARIFLLRCLVEAIDFREHRNQSSQQQHQIALLASELDNFYASSNFSSI